MSTTSAEYSHGPGPGCNSSFKLFSNSVTRFSLAPPIRTDVSCGSFFRSLIADQGAVARGCPQIFFPSDLHEPFIFRIVYSTCGAGRGHFGSQSCLASRWRAGFGVFPCNLKQGLTNPTEFLSWTRSLHLVPHSVLRLRTSDATALFS